MLSADTIKSTVNMPMLAAALGLTVNRAGFIRCPFHTGDKNGSLKLYDGFTRNDGFRCFACGAHGSVIDFVMRYENLSFPAAVTRVASLFGIADAELSAADKKKIQAQKLEREKQARRLVAGWHELRRMAGEIAVMTGILQKAIPYSTAFCDALERRAYLSVAWEILFNSLCDAAKGARL